MSDWINCSDNNVNSLNLDIFIGTGKIPFRKWSERLEKHFYKTSTYKLLFRFNIFSSDVTVDLKLIDNKDKIYNSLNFKTYDKKMKIDGTKIDYSVNCRFNTFSFNKTLKKMNYFRYLLVIMINNEKYVKLSPPFYIFAKKCKSPNGDTRESPSPEIDVVSNAINNIIDKKTDIDVIVDEHVDDKVYEESSYEYIDESRDSIIFPLTDKCDQDVLENYFAITNFDQFYDVNGKMEKTISSDSIFGRISHNNGTLLFDYT
jgi:hypothetical protein